MRAERYRQPPRLLDKDRRNAEKIRGAADIKRRLRWLEHPLVYWGGSRPDVPFQTGLPFLIDACYRPLLALAANRLSNDGWLQFSVR